MGPMLNPREMGKTSFGLPSIGTASAQLRRIFSSSFWRSRSVSSGDRGLSFSSVAMIPMVQHSDSPMTAWWPRLAFRLPAALSLNKTSSINSPPGCFFHYNTGTAKGKKIEQFRLPNADCCGRICPYTAKDLTPCDNITDLQRKTRYTGNHPKPYPATRKD